MDQVKTTKFQETTGKLLAGLISFALFAKRQGRPEIFQWAEETLARFGLFNEMPEDPKSLDSAMRGMLLMTAAMAASEGNQTIEQAAHESLRQFGYALQLSAHSATPAATITH